MKISTAKLCIAHCALCIVFALPVVAAWQPVDAPRNVIIMVPDGTHDTLYTLARWYKNEPLALDEILRGKVRTYADSALITDSAAAATAMSTGFKTYNGWVNLAPHNIEVPGLQPLATLLEAAQRSGRSVGIVTTDMINGATPAAFGGAHTVSRSSSHVITQHMVNHQIDVVFGGGFGMLFPKARGGLRDDDLDLDLAWIAAGGVILTNRAQLAEHKSGRVWGGFAQWGIAPLLDRAATHPEQPSLQEMTFHAIRLLNQNKKGFFLMVEGGRPDHYAHPNDIAGALHEVLEFDQAVKVALDFAKADRRTLLLIASDHETGAPSIGSYRGGSSAREAIIDPIRRMKATSEHLVRVLGDDPGPANVAIQMQLLWGVKISDEAAAEILENAKTAPYGLQGALNAYMWRNVFANIGWATHGHAGGDVAFFGYGIGAPMGLIDNTDIARAAAAALRVDLDATTAALFADSKTIFPDAQCMPEENPNHLLLGDGSKIPFHDAVRIFPDGSRRPLGGLAVYIPETKLLHLPRAAAKNSKK